MGAKFDWPAGFMAAELVLSHRAQTLPRNLIRELTPLANAAKKEGIETVCLNLGQPDNPTPREVLSAGIKYLDETDMVGYGDSRIEPDTSTAILEFFQTKLGIEGLALDRIQFTQGASEALWLSMFALADPGDVLLTPEPYYSNYLNFAHMFGVVLKPITSRPEDGYHLIRPGEDLNEARKRIEAIIEPKTKAIIWSSPGNPAGVVYSRDELALLKSIADQNGLGLCADEAYNLLAYDENCVQPGELYRAPSIFDVASPDNRKNVVGMMSFSKMIGFCGGRAGILIAEPPVSQKLVDVASARGSASVISEEAVAGINQVPIEYFTQYQEAFKHRRNILFEVVRELGLSVHKPEGAFYLIAGLGDDIIAEHFCRWLLTDYIHVYGRQQTVFLTPLSAQDGSGFYLSEAGKATGIHQVRMAYVAQSEDLKTAGPILKDALRLYRETLLD